MTRFEKYKRDLTVEEFTKAKVACTFRSCKGCERENIGRCTGDQCDAETIKYWNEEVGDAN